MRIALIALVACGTQPATHAPAPATGDVVEAVEAGGVTYVFRAARMTNLLYALDCLAQLHVCSHDAFAADWHAGWTADDDRAIAAWKHARRYDGNIDDGTHVETTPLPVAYHPRSIANALRIAGYGARDREDYLARLGVFASGADVATARDQLARFGARAEQKWTADRARMAAAVAEYAELARRADIRALSAKIAAFYQLDRAGLHQTFELIARPDHKSSSSGEQLGELGIVEVPPSEPARQQFAVVLHEMFHAWFQASPIDQQVALVQRFAQSGDPLAGPAYGLLDEVLATALGNGLVQRFVDRAEYDRRVQQDRGFYDEPLVDRMAKAMVPVLEARLAAGKSLFDADFVAEYLRSFHTAFPDGLPPIAFLRPMVCAVDPALAGVQDHLMEASHASYIDCASPHEDAPALLAKHASWGTAIVWQRDHLDALAPLVDAPTLATLRTHARAWHQFVWMKPRALGALFVLVADDAAAATKLIDAFAQRPAGELREGIYAP